MSSLHARSHSLSFTLSALISIGHPSSSMFCLNYSVGTFFPPYKAKAREKHFHNLPFDFPLIFFSSNFTNFLNGW